MPDFSVQYEHMGRLCEAVLPAANLDDAYARLESLKATGELDDGQIIEVLPSDDLVEAFNQSCADALSEQLERIRRG